MALGGLSTPQPTMQECRSQSVMCAKEPGTRELIVNSGFRVQVLDLGASIRSIGVPTPSGVVDVVLGYPAVGDYLSDVWFLGSTIGRYANRLAHGRFRLGTSDFAVSQEAPDGHCLHGGPSGFHRQRWQSADSGVPGQAVYRHTSRHGEGGFPGHLDVQVVYTVESPSRLVIDYTARSDRLTVLSMTNHAYFNLHGNSASVDGHEITIASDRYTPVDGTGIPDGTIATVDDTRFDFRRPRLLTPTDCYDTSFVLSTNRNVLRDVATVYSPISGIALQVRTTQPCLQFYTGEGLDRPFSSRAGLCLETQQFVDAPNQPTFPPATLAPGDLYQHRTVYEFSAM